MMHANAKANQVIARFDYVSADKDWDGNDVIIAENRGECDIGRIDAIIAELAEAGIVARYSSTDDDFHGVEIVR